MPCYTHSCETPLPFQGFLHPDTLPSARLATGRVCNQISSISAFLANLRLCNSACRSLTNDDLEGVTVSRLLLLYNNRVTPTSSKFWQSRDIFYGNVFL